MHAPHPLPLATLPTPLRPMSRLGEHLGFAPGALWVKRDDLTGLAGGGNKARKLAFLVADALRSGCDTLLTGGAAQSNHVRMTAAAAAMSGLRCVAVLGGHPRAPEGNVVLDYVLGAEIVWAGDYDAERLETLMAETCLRLETEGARAYEIPLGGASEVGTLGYVAAAHEIAAEAPIGSVVYTAVGTGGTFAGLGVGLGHLGRVRGIDVGAVPDVEDRIKTLLAGTASLAGRPMPEGSVALDTDQVGDGYGAPSDAAREAIDLAARHEGLLLDPVYTAKALAGLVADRRSGRLATDQPVVFVHTGGAPALFTERYRGWLCPLGAGDGAD